MKAYLSRNSAAAQLGENLFPLACAVAQRHFSPSAAILASLLLLAGFNSLAQVLADQSTGFIATAHGHSGYKFRAVTGPGNCFVYPLALNDSRHMLLETVDFTPYIYSGAGYLPVSPAGVDSLYAWGMNNAEQVVGYGDGGAFAFVYAGGMLSKFAVPGATYTAGYGISSSGAIVGCFGDGNGGHGFILSAGGFTPYDVPGESMTVFRGLNVSGLVIGSIYPDGNEQGFVYDSNSGAQRPLRVPGSVSCCPLAINDYGQIVGQYYGTDGRTHGFVEESGRFLAIDYPSGVKSTNVNTIVTGINNQGDIVGWAWYSATARPVSRNYPKFHQKWQLTSIPKHGRLQEEGARSFSR